MNIFTILGYIVFLSLIVTAILLGAPFAAFIDIPSIIVVMGIAWGMMLIIGGARTAKDVAIGILPGIAVGVILYFFLPYLLGEPSEEEEVMPFLFEFIALSIALFVMVIFVWGKAAVRGETSLGGALTTTFVFSSLFGLFSGNATILHFLNDPNSIGPAMAVCLLTTLYALVSMMLFSFPLEDRHVIAHRKFDEYSLGRILGLGYPTVSFSFVLICFFLLLFAMGQITTHAS
ncbi:MAG: hypothetical protein AB1656_14040 [Candidatus Omnitrophota bacterium]